MGEKRDERGTDFEGESFRILSEAVPHLVWASDSEGRADYFNSLWGSYTGQTFEEAGGLGWLSTVHPEDLSRTQEQWTLAVATGTPYEAEYRIRGKDGTYRWFLSRGIPQRDVRGGISHWFGTCTDITAQKELEEALIAARRAAEEAAQAKSEFLATMSHEIRTPMTVFMAAIEHLLQIEDDPDNRQWLEMADQSAERLHTLIDDILDFSRIEARRVDLEEKPFHLADCVNGVVEMLAYKAKEKKLLLRTEISPDLPPEVLGDQGRLGQVLMNLIDNAIKFTPEGEVVVRVELREDVLFFSVTDTGIGISEGKDHLLFQKFRQLDSSLTRRYGGTGLGLAISKGLIELMGGEMGAKRREGRGSVFFFDLPMRVAGEPLPETTERPVGIPAPGVSLLVVDDEPVVRDVIRMLLEEQGWSAETSATGEEAIEKLRRGSFDVVLMDVHMPGMSGPEAAIAIREMEKASGKRSCIIGLTADVRDVTRRTCLSAGMDGYLSKPVRSNELFSTVTRYLSRGASDG